MLGNQKLNKYPIRIIKYYELKQVKIHAVCYNNNSIKYVLSFVMSYFAKLSVVLFYLLYNQGLPCSKLVTSFSLAFLWSRVECFLELFTTMSALLFSTKALDPGCFDSSLPFSMGMPTVVSIIFRSNRNICNECN